jgi:hypothetical protein
LRLFFYLIEDQSGLNYEEFLQQMDGKQLGQFREDFWSEVVNFSDPLKKTLLQDLWRDYRKQVKKASTSETSEQSSSDS